MNMQETTHNTFPFAKSPTVSTVKCNTLAVKLLSRLSRRDNATLCPVWQFQNVLHSLEDSEGD